MRLFIALLMLFSFQPPSMIQVSWSYPFNNSTFRNYVCDNCYFDSIAESGNEYPEYDDNGAQAQSITLYGDVDDGTVTLVPVAPCWQVTLTSDYSLLKRTWLDSTCHRVFMPLVSDGR